MAVNPLSTSGESVRETLDRWAAEATERQLLELAKAIEIGLALATGDYRLPAKRAEEG